MSRSPVATIFDSFLVWIPTLAIAAAIVWILSLGVMNLEMTSEGTEVFVGNQETTNTQTYVQSHTVNTTSESGTETLMIDALAAGDLAAMQAVFAKHDA